MEETHKELFKYLGIPEEIEDLETVKKDFDTRFVSVNALPERKDLIAPLFAKKMGELEVDTKRAYKDLGVEWEDNELKGKSVKEINELGAKRVQGIWDAKEAELKTQIGVPDDKKAKEWEAKYNTAKLDLETEQKATREVAGHFETFKLESVKNAVEKDRKRAQDQLWASVKYDDSATDMHREGFKTILKKDFTFDFAEDGETLEVRERKTNTLLSNKQKLGSFLTPAEFLQEKAIEANIWKLSPEQKGAATKAPATTQRTTVVTPESGRPPRARHANAG